MTRTAQLGLTLALASVLAGLATAMRLWFGLWPGFLFVLFGATLPAIWAKGPPRHVRWQAARMGILTSGAAILAFWCTKAIIDAWGLFEKLGWDSRHGSTAFMELGVGALVCYSQLEAWNQNNQPKPRDRVGEIDN